MDREEVFNRLVVEIRKIAEELEEGEYGDPDCIVFSSLREDLAGIVDTYEDLMEEFE